MFTKSVKVSPNGGINGMILIDCPNQNDVSFYADIPVREGNIVTVVTAVKNDGKYLCDMPGASVPMYYRELEESGLRHVATINFPDGIPEDYKQKLDGYQCEDFIIEYHEECIVEV